jgi:fatty acid desaturase
MRTDPSDTGGLFITRRPGTRPTRYRTPPRTAGETRRRADGLFAAFLLFLMVLVNLCFWGPLPLLCLFVGGRLQHLTDSVGVGLLASFGTLIGGLLLGLMALKRLDLLWILVRRASGVDQRQGVIGRIFMICCAIGAPIFLVWLLGFSGAQLSGAGNMGF